MNLAQSAPPPPHVASSNASQERPKVCRSEDGHGQPHPRIVESEVVLLVCLSSQAQPRLRISYRVTGHDVAQEMRETRWQLI